MKQLLVALVWLALASPQLAAACRSLPQLAAGPRPNVIFIVTDDQG